MQSPDLNDDKFVEWMAYNLETFGVEATKKKLVEFLHSFVASGNVNGQTNILSLLTALNEELNEQPN